MSTRALGAVCGDSIGLTADRKGSDSMKGVFMHLDRNGEVILKAIRYIAMFAACTIVALVTVVPAGANNKPVTGTRIGLLAPPSLFAANTPFYIEQGFACQLADSVCMSTQIGGQADFALYLDGVLQPSTVDVDVANDVIRRADLTNFGSGLSGTHTFLGVWTLAGVQVQSTSVTITFS